MDMTRNGSVKCRSAIIPAIDGAKTKRIMEPKPPNIQLNENAVCINEIDASFFCIIAEPKPASVILVHIVVMPLSAAK